MINYTAQFTEIPYLKNLCHKFWNSKAFLESNCLTPLFDQLCIIFLQASCRIINYLAHWGSHRSIGRIFDIKMWNLIFGLGTRRTSWGPKWSIWFQIGPNVNNAVEGLHMTYFPCFLWKSESKIFAHWKDCPFQINVVKGHQTCMHATCNDAAGCHLTSKLTWKSRSRFLISRKQTNERTQFGLISKLFLIFGSMWAGNIRVPCMQLVMLLQGVKIVTLPPNWHGSHEVHCCVFISRILY